MSIFSKLFRKPDVQTPLEAFVSTITPEQSQTTYRSVKDESLRLPAALSTWVLYLTHRFSSGLREMLASVDKKTPFAFDPIAFETAAFCHYWLMRDILNADDDQAEDEIYFECLKASASITSSLLASKTSFALPTELLMQRSMAYSHEEKCKAVRPEDKFAQFLISSFQSGSPATKAAVGISSSLPLQLSIASYIPIFESTQLAEFKTVARAMFLADQEGAL
ncbi:hypothetical protein [Thiobacillus sp.]